MKQAPKKSKPSQQQIAAHLGVSQALVSMVLNGRSKGINSETYSRIWDHAVSVGYTPKGMRMEENGSAAHPTQVGFILRAGLTLYTQSNFFSHVQHGLHGYLEEEGYSTMFLGTETTLTENGFRSLDQMQKQLFGVVIMGEVELSFLKKIRQTFPKLVVVSASYPGFCHSVLNNEAQSVELILDHLWSLGHRTFAWIGGNRGMARHEQRFAAFRQALENRDGQCAPEWIGIADDGDRMEGRTIAQQLLERLGRENLPTAWVGYNGLVARGAANYLASQQISVPEEVSIAAIDGTRVCEEDEPTLTSAFADPERLGAVTGELLLKATGEADEIFSNVVLPATLTVRGSTARPRGELAASKSR